MHNHQQGGQEHNIQSLTQGEDKKVMISQNLLLNIVLSDVVVEQGLYGQPGITDLNWNGLRVDGNVPMEFGVDGKTVTRYKHNLWLSADHLPRCVQLVKDASYKHVLDEPLLDFSRLNEQPIDKWHRLINPIAGQVQGQEVGFKEEGAKAVTVEARPVLEKVSSKRRSYLQS